MWRATVIESISPGWVTVTVPDLYRGAPIREVQCAVDAQPGERVILVDLNPQARTHGWYVLGFESQIGRGLGSPEAAHTHPIGQVDGLSDALAAKADVSALTGYATTSALSTGLSSKADASALANYATTTALSNGLSGKVNTSTYTSGMSGKADVPGAWANCSVTSYLTVDTATGSPALAVRNTSLGVQVKGRYRTASAVPMDAVVFTLPAGFTPTHPILIGIPTMGPGTAYAALTYQFEIQTNGTVTARQDFVSGARLTFNQIFTL